MDLVNQNKFKNILIILLLVVNIISLSIIWMQTTEKKEAIPVEGKKPKTESVSLMKEVLNLNDDQTKKLEKLRSDKLDLSKKYNDSLSLLKKQLAEELFKSKSNQELVQEKTKMIGELQSKVERVRFDHFNELLAICTPEQKIKLKPIIEELFGRKPPKDELPRKTEIAKNRKPREEQKVLEEKPAPPVFDEKVEKYSRRLNLSPEQQEQLRKILADNKQRNVTKRIARKLNPEEFEKEKERMRIEEDERVMSILTEEQKVEFDKMQMKRKK